MAPIDYSASGLEIREEIGAAHEAALDRFAGAGSWWSGAQRIALIEAAREARAQRLTPPWQREAASPPAVPVPAEALEVARTVAADAHRVDRDVCRGRVAELGDAAYVEIVALVACVSAMDAFCEAIGVDPPALPEPRPGEPDRQRPEGVGDIGAFVDAALGVPGPNVGRALSLAPLENATFFRLVGAMYALEDFGAMVWEERPLSRPQVELVAARVSALNECFY